MWATVSQRAASSAIQLPYRRHINPPTTTTLTPTCTLKRGHPTLLHEPTILQNLVNLCQWAYACGATLHHLGGCGALRFQDPEDFTTEIDWFCNGYFR